MSNTNNRVPHESVVILATNGQISDVYSFRRGSNIEVSLTSTGDQVWDGEVTLQVLDENTRTWDTMTLTLPDLGDFPMVLSADLPRLVSDPLAADALVRWIVSGAPSVVGEMQVTATLLGYNSDHSLSLSVTDNADATPAMGVKRHSRIAYSYAGVSGYDGVVKIQTSPNAFAWDTFAAFTGESSDGYVLSPPLERDLFVRLVCEAPATTGSATLILNEVVFAERVDPDTLCTEENAQRIAEDTSRTMGEIAEANAKDFAMAQDVVVLADADAAAAARDEQVLLDADAAAALRDLQVLVDAEATAAGLDAQVLLDAAAAAAIADGVAIAAHEAKTTSAGHASETVWKDLVGDVMRATAGGSSPTLTTIVGGIMGLAFNNTAVNEIFMSFHVPHDVKPNTRMIPHFHWMPVNTGSGNVEWHFEYSYAPRNGGADDVFPSTTTLTAVDAAGGVTLAHRVTEITDPNQGILVQEPDGVILARVYRDGGAGNLDDTYAASVFLTSVDLHYQSDRDGTPSRDPDYYTP